MLCRTYLLEVLLTLFRRGLTKSQHLLLLLPLCMMGEHRINDRWRTSRSKKIYDLLVLKYTDYRQLTSSSKSFAPLPPLKKCSADTDD
eukprot:scaffold721_cov202-Alexandrium_tamarense.AAC.15